MGPGCAMVDVSIHRSDPSAIIVFLLKCISLVLFMQLLATCDKRNASSKYSQCRRLSFYVDHLSLSAVFLQVSATTPVVTCTSFPTISIPHPFPPPFPPALLFAKVASPSMLISESKASIAPEGTILGRQARGWVGRWVGPCF